MIGLQALPGERYLNGFTSTKAPLTATTRASDRSRSVHFVVMPKLAQNLYASKLAKTGSDRLAELLGVLHFEC
jgi:hypothetical protein